MSIIFKTFRTYAHPYVYDRHTGSVLMLTEDEYKEFVAVEKGELEAEKSKVIQKYYNQGFLQHNVVQKIEHSSTGRLEPYLKTRVKQLTLQVTQQCNLRCEYCAYSGIYESIRTHNSKRMNFETAKKAIDYFLDNNIDLADVFIGFYGGEPLLEFELIKKCVAYADGKVEGKRISYSMTTNGTLLTDKVVDFLAEHDFAVSISLDGSKEEHDVNRKFKDGTGSFDTVISNIQRIRDRYPEFDKRIQIMTTINPYMDLGCVMEYFSTDEIFNDKSIMFNAMNEMDLKEEISYSDKYYWVRNFEYIKCLFAAVGKIETKYVSQLIKRSIGTIKQFWNRTRQHAPLSRIAHHNGPCLPGVRKLYVSTDGKYFPCERVNELKDYFCIGSVEEGIRIEKSKRMLNIGQLTENQCKNCWALRLCSSCAGQIEFDEEPITNDKLKNCRSAKIQALFNLRELCVLNEFGIVSDEMGLYL